MLEIGNCIKYSMCTCVSVDSWTYIYFGWKFFPCIAKIQRTNRYVFIIQLDELRHVQISIAPLLQWRNCTTMTLPKLSCVYVCQDTPEVHPLKIWSMQDCLVNHISIEFRSVELSHLLELKLKTFHEEFVFVLMYYGRIKI